MPPKQVKQHGYAEGDDGQLTYGVIGEVEASPSKSRRLREVLSDAYTFIRSAESNRALATVTIEQLMEDQIKRNGNTEDAEANKYNPYAHEPDKEQPAGSEPEKQANFLGGSDTQRATKLDMLLAIKNELDAVVEDVKNTQPIDVASREEYQESAEIAAPEA